MKNALLTAALACVAMTAHAATDRQPAGSNDPTSFQQVDSDRDGRISRQEAAAFSALEARFEAADANGDGVLSADEFARSKASRPRR